MVKAWSIIIAIVLYCAILGDGKSAMEMVSPDLYPRLKEVCKPEVMKVFTDCLKKDIDADKVDKLQKTLMDIKICEVMPDPCNVDIFKAALIKIGKENKNLVKELVGFASKLNVLKGCLPNVKCPK